MVGVKLSPTRTETFGKVWDLAHEYAGVTVGGRRPILVARSAIPYLNEPW